MVSRRWADLPTYRYGRPNVVEYAGQSPSSCSYEERHWGPSGLNFTPYSAPTKPSHVAISQPSSSTVTTAVAAVPRRDSEAWRASSTVRGHSPSKWSRFTLVWYHRSHVHACAPQAPSSPYQSGSAQSQAAGGLRVNAPKKWGPSGFNARKPSATSEEVVPTAKATATVSCR